MTSRWDHDETLPRSSSDSNKPAAAPHANTPKTSDPHKETCQPGSRPNPKSPPTKDCSAADILQRRDSPYSCRAEFRKTTVGEVLLHPCRSVRINQRFKRVVRGCLTAGLAIERFLQRRKRIQMMLLRAVKPVWQGRIRDPWIQGANVVRHGVKENLHLLFVRRSHQFLVILQRTQVGISGVQIHRVGSAVMLRRAILHQRREP